MPPGAAGPTIDPAVAAAERRVHRRQEARTLLRRRPELAQELRIGRPDLPRRYDDGGLVDVNHVPAETLVRELELPAPQARDVVDQRELRRGFTSPEELVVYCGVAPARLAVIRDRLIFVPY